MKPMLAKDFKLVGQKVPNAMAELAKKLILEFADSGAEVMELEPEDLENRYDFSNKIELGKAANLMRSRLERNDLHDDERIDKVCIKQRGNRLFICQRDLVEEPVRRYW